MAPRGYGQYDGLARAAELVGERWALLIVRDLLVGPRRYTDLKSGLPRIPTNILSDRLRELQAGGLVHRVPIARCGLVYALTPAGRALEPAVLALVRWGSGMLGEPADGELVTRDSLTIELRARFRPEAARAAPPARYTVHVGEAAVAASVVDGALDVVPVGDHALPQPLRAASAFTGPLPEVELAVAPGLGALLAAGHDSAEDAAAAAAARGALRVLGGDPALVAGFVRSFRQAADAAGAASAAAVRPDAGGDAA